MIYIGKKGTFGNHPIGIEVHLLKFSGTLLRQTLTIQLEHKIREDQVFPNKDALIHQINLDIKSAEAILQI